MRRAAYIVVLLMAALVPSACGGANGGGDGQALEDVLAEVEGLTGRARTAKLVELAQAEGGELSLYTTTSTELATELTDAFEEAYDIGVSVYKTGGSAILQRLVEERDADFHGADVVETNGVNLRLLTDEETLVPYRSPSAAALVSGALFETWTADKFDTLLAAWNADNVSGDEVPESYEELAGPRWKGRLALEVEDSAWFKSLHDYWVRSGKTSAEADRLFERIARNSVFLDGRALIRELLAAGEFDLAPSLQLHNVRDMIEDGAPLAYEPVVEPAFTRPDGVAIVDGAPHPAAAMLFIDWLLGDGQQVISDFGADAARRDLVVEPTLDRVAFDIDGYLAVEDEWTARWERLVRLGGKQSSG